MPKNRTKPWGTGQAVLACKGLLKEPFAVINADDYYGKEAFAKIHEFLENVQEPNQFCMAGFILKNTLSDNGGVTRGICKVNEMGYLTDVVETKNIIKTEIGAEADGKEINVDSYVSMNMWGMTPEFIDLLEKGFIEFFEKIGENEVSAEYLLPIYIDELLQKKQVSVKVLETKDKWVGVTYKEDKETVVNYFKKLIQDGVYFKKLCGKKNI